MKKIRNVVVLLALAAIAPGQELPKATPEGKKAATELLAASVQAGALQLKAGSSPAEKHHVVTDEMRLRAFVQQRRRSFTPAIRDALLQQYEHPGVIALLLEFGQSAADEQAVAFASFFTARSLTAQLAFAKARKSYEQAATLFGKLEMKSWQATSIHNLGEVFYHQGQLSLARQSFEDSLVLLKQVHGEKSLAVAECVNSLALIAHYQGDLVRARRLHYQALDLRRLLVGERSQAVAQSLANLAVVCHDQGDLPQARKLSEQALDLKKRLLGERHRSVAVSLNNLALLCYDQEDYPQARKFHQQALELFREAHGERHTAVATSLLGLGAVCRVQDDLAQADKHFGQALAIFKQIHGERHPDIAAALGNLAGISRQRGEAKEARRLLVQSVEMKQQLYGNRHGSVARSHQALAELSLHQGEPAQAVLHATAAILACRSPQVKSEKLTELTSDDLACEADTVVWLRSLGSLLQAADKQESLATARQAEHVYTLAAQLLDRLRTTVLETEESKVDQGARQARLVPARVQLASALFRLSDKAEDLHTAVAAIEQGRSRVFLEALARARAHHVGGVPDRLFQTESNLKLELQRAERGLKEENGKTQDRRDEALVARRFEELKQKRDDLDRFADRLRRDYPRYAALQYPRPCSLANARECLGEHEVAVLFAVDQKESHAVVVRKKAAADDRSDGITIVKLPGAEVLAQRVRTLVNAEVLKSDSRCRRLGSELYALLLEPLARYIEGKDLLLIPDGVLWELPFELLVENGAEGHYLIEKRQVRYAPSLTVLHLIAEWEKVRRAPPEPLWALADPLFRKNDRLLKSDLHRDTRELLERYARRNRGGTSWVPLPLPATRLEVESIARLHGVENHDIVTGLSACEKVVKTASEKGILARKRHVHFATHGILGSAQGRQPSLVLSLLDNDGLEEGGGVNDGFLTMEEVTHLKLNADLVVLSACETGKGDLRAGEGVIGLSRAFLHAGSRGVVCSLWHVDDEQTSHLMQAMYGHLKDGKSSSEALTLARRKLIAEEQAPLYWAPFILIGK